MKYDNIEIAGKQYRIEFNWNAVSAWMDETNLEFETLTDVKKIKGSALTELCYQSVLEGCRMEGVEFPYSKMDFGAALHVNIIADFFKILKRHMESMTTVIHPKKK